MLKTIQISLILSVITCKFVGFLTGFVFSSNSRGRLICKNSISTMFRLTLYSLTLNRNYLKLFFKV